MAEMDAAACMTAVLAAIQANAGVELTIALTKLREVCSSQDEFEEMLCQPQYLAQNNYSQSTAVLVQTINWERPGCLNAVLEAAPGLVHARMPVCLLDCQGNDANREGQGTILHAYVWGLDATMSCLGMGGGAEYADFQVLMAHGVDVHARTDDGRTALKMITELELNPGWNQNNCVGKVRDKVVAYLQSAGAEL